MRPRKATRRRVPGHLQISQIQRSRRRDHAANFFLKICYRTVCSFTANAVTCSTPAAALEADSMTNETALMDTGIARALHSEGRRRVMGNMDLGVYFPSSITMPALVCMALLFCNHLSAQDAVPLIGQTTIDESPIDHGCSPTDEILRGSTH